LIGPLLLVFLLMDQILPATILLVLCGLTLSSGYAPMVVLGQSYLPNRVGLASGISLGVVVSMGGIAAPGLGAIGDTWGLRPALAVLCVISLIGISIASTLYMGRNAKDKVGEPTRKKPNNAQTHEI
jgi:FSR family fosmidomycin resistance protein-like MFS transporter